MVSAAKHEPVLLKEVVEALAPRSPGVYIDATCGLGGHAEAILEASAPEGRLLAVDRDPEALKEARPRLSRFGDRVTFLEGHFSELARFASDTNHSPADGLVADLGVSSLQLDDRTRGFSFQGEGPLDMRMGPIVGETAKELLARLDAESLATILYELGEVKSSRAVARSIIEARDAGELETTRDLTRVVEKKLGKKRWGAIHPATQVFQAIRIATNRELDELEALLRALPEILKPGGKAAIISFHSLEDRLVKNAFRGPQEEPPPRWVPIRGEIEKPRHPLSPLTKKPITASEEEIERNPRSRSAKLRVAERTM
jgi:16S rRNA (cytosine1402-N4)-methyltransferase